MTIQLVKGCYTINYTFPGIESADSIANKTTSEACSSEAVYVNKFRYNVRSELPSAVIGLPERHFRHRARGNVTRSYPFSMAANDDLSEYLRHTMLSSRKIARLCGYENDVVFLRPFKRAQGRPQRGSGIRSKAKPKLMLERLRSI